MGTYITLLAVCLIVIIAITIPMAIDVDARRRYQEKNQRS